jgi:small conductance mechanosensitive channel
MVISLTQVLAVIWKDDTHGQIQEECRLIADDVLKQYVAEKDRTEKNNDFYREYFYSANALRGWDYAYGEMNRAELKMIQEDDFYPAQAAAVLKGDKYEVLEGQFPREIFDAVLEAGERKRWELYYEEPAPKNEIELFDINLAEDGTSCMVLYDGNVYVMSELISARTIVISHMGSDSYLITLAGDDDLSDFSKFTSEFLYDPEMEMVIISKDDNKVIHATDGIDPETDDLLTLELNNKGKVTIGDTSYSGGMAEIDKYKVYALLPDNHTISKYVVSPLFLASLFTLVFLLTGLYAWFLRKDIRLGRVDHGNFTNNKEILGTLLIKRVRTLFYMATGIVSVIIFMICILYIVNDNRLWGDDILEDVERYYEIDSDYAADLAFYHKSFKHSAIDLIRDMMDNSPERMTPDSLADLSDAIASGLYVLDKNGVVVSACYGEYDFTGISDPKSQLYPLLGVLQGKADHLTVNLVDQGDTYLCWAVRLNNGEQVLISIDDLSKTIDISDYYANYQAPKGMTLYTVDLESQIVLSSSNTKYSGKDAAKIGLTEDVLKDGFAGDIILEGRRSFVHTEIQKERADVISSDLFKLLSDHLPVILSTIVIGILEMLLMLFIAFRFKRNIWRNPLDGIDLDAGKNEPGSFYYKEGGTLQADRAAVGRWLNPRIPFNNLSADEKLNTVLHLLLAAILIAGYIMYNNKSTTNVLGSAMFYLLQRKWHTGLNIYAITYAALIDCVIIVVGLALRWLILLIGGNYDSRGETISRLIGSFITYLSVAFAIGYSLIFLGVNTTAIFASAGIVGLAISIGAKDMIADIFAGIFIVFEGEFRTGDIVDIKGFRGTVEEIGLRTTKVMSMENVKVFRNSEVGGAINMTQRYSIAEVRIDVTRAEPLEEIEKIFTDALPKIRENIKYEVSKIKLCGIDQMTADGLVLLFQTNCKESERIFVERELRREFDLLMERELIASSGAIGSGSIRSPKN